MIDKNTKQFIFLGAIMMALAVALGAFGAHGLKKILSVELLTIYHTGVEYQFYHALGLFAVAFVSYLSNDRKAKIAGYLMFVSTLIFSGSLYIIAFTGIKVIGAITPIGGVGFIISWVLLALCSKHLRL